MAFLETPRFPDDIAYGSQGGPRYNTTIIQVSSGYESRNSNWQYPLHAYDVAYGIRTQDKLDALIAYFHAVGGAAEGFRFKDFGDYRTVGAKVGLTVSETDQEFGVGNASDTIFQLRKNYTQGALTRQRIITKPISGTVLIAVNAVLQTETTDYSIDYTTGLVTFVSPPGNGLSITWGGEFDVPVRFESDTLNVNLDSYDSGEASVPLVEIRV